MKQISILFCLFIFTNSCIKENLPNVITTPITEFTWDYAIAGGEVIDDGGSQVISRGVSARTKWDQPWLTVDGSGTGSFESKINIIWHGASMSIRDTHYLRAYATNRNGTSYGEELSFYPKLKPPDSNSIELRKITATTNSIIVAYSLSIPPVRPWEENGICYNTTGSPSIEGAHIVAAGPYTSTSIIINNLLPNTKYYICGYIKNESGISYTGQQSISTTEGEISDIDGNIYQIKTIGNQVWTIENLKVSNFKDGTPISFVEDNLSWNSTFTSAYSTYNPIYGKLYNYYAIADTRKLCPTGWHVPTDEDWKILEVCLGMSQIQADATGLRGIDQGGKLKQIGCPDFWTCQNIGATNSSGFSALGGGYRYDNGIFSEAGLKAYYWSSTEYDAISSWARSISNNNTQVGRSSIKKGFGFSVRCIKD
ncbi:MAG: fibrobacter succinogenes major paralogous domain-containing protein [Bacteroidales bacterium]|nr:fibrobacter succinogenes major paralogous domain-containing protein [Bacteroidales bacterium]